ncbi:MAG: ATP-binding protein [Methylococcales bacterium]|nr:ATP-binding protein [Methylococcales bacterium]
MTNKINYIEKVEISGLWQRYDITWNLNPDVNILAGINGSGKSTIFDCISGLVSTGKIPEPRLPMVKKIDVFFNDGKNISPEITSEIKENGMPNVNIISTFDNSLTPIESVRKLSNSSITTELDLVIFLLQKQYLEYQINILQREIDSRKQYALTMEGIKNKKTKFEEIQLYFADVDEKIGKIQFSKEKFLEIIDELFSETGKRINREKNEVEFLLGDKEITPFQLSSGEKQLLIILLTVLIQDNKPSILFMDEPEISLHIEWQKKIIKYIRELNPNVQVIIATHSPAIIMEGWMDKVFEVRDLIVKDYEKL